jgi:hypothetical protein
MNKKLQDKIIIIVSIPLLAMVFIADGLAIGHIRIPHIYIDILGIYAGLFLVVLCLLYYQKHYPGHKKNGINQNIIKARGDIKSDTTNNK